MQLSIGAYIRRATKVLLLTLGGCGAGDGAAPPYTVRDSAGMQIVESTAALWSGAEARYFPAEPALQIGVLDEEGPYQFHSIRAALLLEDGRILVADGGSRSSAISTRRGSTCVRWAARAAGLVSSWP